MCQAKKGRPKNGPSILDALPKGRERGTARLGHYNEAAVCVLLLREHFIWPAPLHAHSLEPWRLHIPQAAADSCGQQFQVRPSLHTAHGQSFMMSGLLIKGLLITQAAVFQNIQENSFSFRNIRFDSKYFCFIRKTSVSCRNIPQHKEPAHSWKKQLGRAVHLYLSLSLPLSLSRSLSLSLALSATVVFSAPGVLDLGRKL